MIAIYARQSIEKKDSVSIETQIDKCKSYCIGEKYEIYKDAGYSGKNINRPQFSKLINDIKSGYISKVIAYRLDRISRSIADFSQLLIMFDKYNIDFISATENFDTNSPMGRAMINIVMTFAQLERETIVERVTDNYYFRTNNGYWPGGYAPYGYNIKHIIGNDKKKHSVLEENKEQAKVVKSIYDMYINQNMSMRKISQTLNNKKIPSLKNKSWTINTISSILSRPIYTPATAKIYNYYYNLNSNITNDIEYFDGTMTANLYGKARKTSKVKARRNYDEMYLSLINCTPIISNDDWFKAQEIKGITKYLPPRTSTSKISFLCGLVKCGKCNGNFVTQSCKNRYDKKYYYLMCNTKRNLGVSHCDNQMIDINVLENIVISDIKKYFNSNSILEKVNKYTKNKEHFNIEKKNKKEELENEIVIIDLKIEKLVTSIIEANEVSLKYINKKIEELENEKQIKQKELASIDNISNKKDDIIEYIKNINEKINTNDFQELKILCKTVIDKIVINGKTVDIHYKI